jgi:hypothetical protein
MRRAIRRAGITIVVACATVLAMALPASAKGEVIAVRITTSVSGPGISAPIVLHWGGNCRFPELCGSTENQLDAYSFLNSAGILGFPQDGLDAPAAPLGPKYEITYRGVSRGVVMTVHQDLYPFGPGTSEFDRQRPWIYTLPGQRLFTTVVPGGWIQAPTSLISILRDHGFTVPAPPAASSATAPSAAAIAVDARPGGPAPWALALGALALAAMVTLGAVQGRRRASRRSLGSAPAR